MRIFLIIIWGIMAFISVTGTLYIIINYEIQRWKDMERRRQGAYIRRVNQAEALLTIFTPGFPCLFLYLHLVDEGSAGIFYESIALLGSIGLMMYAWYVHVAYVKISPEGPSIPSTLLTALNTTKQPLQMTRILCLSTVNPENSLPPSARLFTRIIV